MLIGIARMGGFLARKSDGNPGWQTIGRGLRKPMERVEGYGIANNQECGTDEADAPEVQPNRR